MKQILFVINPISARGATLRMWAAARKKLVALGTDFDEHVTIRAGDATQVTRRALKSGTLRVVAVGGDGTLSEVVNGYVDECGGVINAAASIGVLPSGTGSDFARTLALAGWSDSLRTVISSETRMLDAARAEFHDQDGRKVSRLFINVASFGLGGEVSALVNRWRNQWPRWIGGRARFAAAALAALGRYRNIPVSLRLDGERFIQIGSNLIVVANGRFAGGGMLLAPDSKLDDGLLDVIVTDGATRLDVIRELPRIQRGAYLRNPKVAELRAREVSIATEEPMAIDMDGDMVGYAPARLEALSSAIRFVG